MFKVAENNRLRLGDPNTLGLTPYFEQTSTRRLIAVGYGFDLAANGTNPTPTIDN